jgi:hypothetical protein
LEEKPERVEGMKYGAPASGVISGPSTAFERLIVQVNPIFVENRFADMDPVLRKGVLIWRIPVPDIWFATAKEDVVAEPVIAALVSIWDVVIAACSATKELI